MHTSQLPVDLETLVSHIEDEALVAVPSAFSADFSGISMAATRELVKKRVKRLHLLCVPGSSLQADLLIGCGCVSTVEAGSILLYEHGQANRFVAGQKSGAVTMKESTCPAIHAALVAGEKGLPFMPVRGLIGSDILRRRELAGDWKVVDNPFGNDDPIVLVSAIRPDVSLFHVPLADRNGNIWIGRRSELSTLARSARKALVTFERFYDGDLTEDDDKAPATIPAMYLTALSHQPKGAWPLNMGAEYGEDTEHMREYARLAKTSEGFAEYVKRYVWGRCEAA